MRWLVAIALLLMVSGEAYGVRIDYKHKLCLANVFYFGESSELIRDNLVAIDTKLNPKVRPQKIAVPDHHVSITIESLALALEPINGYRFRCDATAVIGPDVTEYYTARRLALKSADAVVFVVDGNPVHRQATLVWWKLLREMLEGQNRDLPITVQLDGGGPGALTVAALRELLELSDNTIPIIEATPATGAGVMETLHSAATQLHTYLARRPLR
jgi:hypothetical protein